MTKIVTDIAECSCGAFTIYFHDKDEVCIPADQFKKLFPNTIPNRKFYSCNYCCNHWGTDLCSCGSGENYKTCNNGNCESGNEPYYTMPLFERLNSQDYDFSKLIG